MTEVTLVGFHLEDGGSKVVLAVLGDPSGDDHEASTPEELWTALMTIASNPDLPRAEYNGEDHDGREEPDSDMQNFANEAVEGIMGDAIGPTFGRLAGAFMRNGGPAYVLRRISRRNNRGTG